MASRLRKGCGIGCAVLLFAVVVVFAIGYVKVKQTFSEVGEATESHEELVERFGEVEEWLPPADGAVPADRMRIFLEVRESLGLPQAKVDTVLATLPPDELVCGDTGVVSKIRIAFGMIAEMVDAIGGYVDARNDRLLEAEMGLGEYLYIYSVAYYSMLGNAPGDVPLITKKTCAEGRTGEPLFDEDSAFDAAEVRRRYRLAILAMLGNQLQAAEQGEPEAWSAVLTGEIERLEARPDRIAWSTGLPPSIAASLEPFRDQLAATYHPGTNCFEFPLAEGEDWGMTVGAK